jgi:hypothetical protein
MEPGQGFWVYDLVERTGLKPKTEVNETVKTL